MTRFSRIPRLRLAVAMLLLCVCTGKKLSQSRGHHRLADSQPPSAPPPEPPPDIGGVGDEVQNPSAYDSHPSMFSPNGRLLQIEYAMTVGDYHATKGLGKNPRGTHGNGNPVSWPHTPASCAGPGRQPWEADHRHPHQRRRVGAVELLPCHIFSCLAEPAYVCAGLSCGRRGAGG